MYYSRLKFIIILEYEIFTICNIQFLNVTLTIYDNKNLNWETWASHGDHTSGEDSEENKDNLTCTDKINEKTMKKIMSIKHHISIEKIK